MAAPISQKEYLKKYLSGGDDGEKKKKKKKKKDKSSMGTQSKGMRIIEDTFDIKNVPFGEGEDDDNPTIAEVTYEDESMKVMEEFQKSKKWKKMGDDQDEANGIGKMVDFGLKKQNLDVQRSKSDMHTQLKRQRHDSDASPPRRLKHNSDSSPPRRKRYDSDESLLSRQGHGSDKSSRRQRHDSDASPPRGNRHDSDTSLPRRQRHDSDASPPRRQRHDSDASLRRRHDSDSDASPPRRPRHDSDASPPRRQRHDSDASPPRRQRNDSDASPPRRQRYDSDASPPRRQRYDSDASPPRRQRQDSDASPPRRQRHDSDTSPPRRKRQDSDTSPPRRESFDNSSANSRPESLEKPLTKDSNYRPERKMTTQEYLLARKRGKLKKDTPEDLLRKEREKKLQLQAEDKHQQWKYGVKQVQQYQQKLADDAREMGKAFARSADDKDLNDKLKEVIREDDPMLEYLQKKQQKESKQPVHPMYKGSFPPNRLNIRPGYRWDGVDRSNGFEKQWFERQNNRQARDEDAYKWSVSDM
ncbi:BUD13 homolog [Macrobrachium nipponense]|uniref:BUD13 homolog n=1 Tax=Macrobrachium nipponense TaxID=159736 RepID=UPI0030C80564